MRRRSSPRCPGLPTGEQIRQEAVADELGVSRIPIREALLQLESEGLVVIRTHKGAVVASLSPEDAIDLFEARMILESMLVKKAIEAATPADVARIGACLSEYEKAVKNGADPETLSRLNWAFHTAMCEPANRPRMMAIVVSLYTATDRYLRLQINRPGERQGAEGPSRDLRSLRGQARRGGGQADQGAHHGRLRRRDEPP